MSTDAMKEAGKTLPPDHYLGPFTREVHFVRTDGTHIDTWVHLSREASSFERWLNVNGHKKIVAKYAPLFKSTVYAMNCIAERYPEEFAVWLAHERLGLL